MSISFRQASFLTSAYQSAQLPADEGVEVAFAGRSNAGKSSAINCLVRQKNLCKTSKTPGRTRLINFFELRPGCRLVDLPGYGFARVSRATRAHWDRVLSDYLLERRALRGLVLVVDIRRGLTDLDRALLDMLDHRLPLHVLLTKSDKLSRSAARRAVDDCERRLDDAMQTVSSLSVVNRDGLDRLERICRDWLEAQ